MSCVLYNIVKEGYISNLTTAPVTQITDEQILALYDGDPSTPAVTISGAGLVVGLLAEFGESYDVCYVDYHTDESAISNVSVKYGTTSGTKNLAPLSLHTSGVYRATVSGVVNFVDIRHTLSASPTNINQLEIIAVKNETLGFGTSTSDQVDQLPLTHATIGTLSASPNIIPLFNDNNSEQAVRVAVAPTFTSADGYLYLATEKDGPYYGINDHGFQQPGPDPILLVDDPMDSDETIHPQWQRRQGAGTNAIIPTKEGIVIDAGIITTASSDDVTTVGLLSKEYFTPSSFTADIEVRFLHSYADFDDASEFGKGFVFAITNGLFIDNIADFRRFTTDGRVGWSTAAVGVSPHGNFGTEDKWYTDFIYKDGVEGDNKFQNETLGRSWALINGFDSGDGLDAAYWARVQGENFSGVEAMVNGGQSLGDFTEGAQWHTWRIVYDHTKQEISGYADKLFLGSTILKDDPFKGGTKFWIGINGENGWKVAVRNFKIHHNKIYRQKNVALPINGGVFSATVSGVPFNLDRIIDQNSSTMYVAPFPDEFTRVRVDFDKAYDIVNYNIHQREDGEAFTTLPTIFGKKHYVETAVTAIVDYGGLASYINVYPPSTGEFNVARPLDNRSPTWSGGAVTVSGVEYLEWQFVDYTTGWPGPQENTAMYIRELNVLAEEWTDALVIPDEPNPDHVRWFEGRWNNLDQSGTKPSLYIHDTRHVEVAYWPIPEYMQVDVNYGYSSAQYENSGTYLYDFAESLFAAPGSVGSGDQAEWYSAVQSSLEPFYLWRYLRAEVDVAVIQVSTENFNNPYIPKEFKFQYLRESGNPNVESDWADIPPMALPHTKTNTGQDLRYGVYKQYKIDNNDGEFYINNNLQPQALSSDPGGVGSFGLTGANTVLGDKIPQGYRPTLQIYNGSTDARDAKSYIIIELDSPIRTRGVRLVVKNPVINTTNTTTANKYAVREFQVWGTAGVGVYTSPVFDTGTAQNTERLLADLTVPPTTAAQVYVRSSSTPPQQSYDTKFETWTPLGDLGQPGFSVVSTDDRGRAITIGDETHFILSQPYVYNHTLGMWSQPYGGYPAQSAGGPSASDTFDTADLGSGITATIRPDPSVDDRAALVGGIIYVAAEETNLTGSDRIMYLDLNSSNPGWRVLGGQRPPNTTNATMCAYGKRLYFFHQAGTVYYWDIDAANWVLLDAVVPVSSGTRSRLTSILYGGKIYIFGANNTSDGASSHEVSIFNPATASFSSGTPSPRAMRQVQPILSEDGVIYVMTRNGLDANQRYYPDEDRWEVFSSLKWSRDYNVSNNVTADFFFEHDGYMYKVDSGQGGMWRTTTRKSQWAPGKFPDPRDYVWGGRNAFTGLPWRPIGSFGELMPQDRYFQFKVEMYSKDWKESPTLNSVKIITPQSVTIPASSSSNVYLKIDASEEGSYRLWYVGKRRIPGNYDGSFGGGPSQFDNDWNILYTSSPVPGDWGHPVTASGFYDYNAPGNNASVWSDGIAPRSPWVQPDGIGGYDVWYGRADINTNLTFNTPPSIYYVNTSEPSNLSLDNLAVEAVPASVVSESDGAVWQPTVVAHSPIDLKMWFTMVDRDPSNTQSITLLATQRIGYATSTDKVNWTGQQVVIGIGEDTNFGYDVLASYRPSVLFDNGIYRMWYTGEDSAGVARILYRESMDGVSWGAIQLSVDIGSQGPDDSQGASKPHVLKDAGTYYMFYFGYDGKTNAVIRAQSPDGLGWDNFTIVMPGSGIEGSLDTEGVDDFFVLVEKPPVVSGSVLTSGKLKIHNEGTGI